jgi:hypothetical protein
MACDHKRALALLRAGQWEEAHRLVQPFSDELSCLIHAYVHRVEGDLENAAYWYRRAGTTMPSTSLEDALSQLTKMSEAR